MSHVRGRSGTGATAPKLAWWTNRRVAIDAPPTSRVAQGRLPPAGSEPRPGCFSAVKHQKQNRTANPPCGATTDQCVQHSLMTSNGLHSPALLLKIAFVNLSARRGLHRLGRAPPWRDEFQSSRESFLCRRTTAHDAAQHVTPTEDTMTTTPS